LSGSGDLEAPFIPFLWETEAAGLGFLEYVAFPDGPSCLDGAGAGLFFTELLDLLKESGASSSSSSALNMAGLTAAIAYSAAAGRRVE
jgi:hypothetical protein